LGTGRCSGGTCPKDGSSPGTPAHAALVSDADFIVAQDTTAPRGPAGPAVRRYLLAGLHLAALAILLVGDGTPDRARRAGITAPAEVADLIDQLRADGVVLTYVPHDQTLHASGHDPLYVTIGKDL
jgi:hypothetical protein